MEIEKEYPYCFHFIWARRKSDYHSKYDVTDMDNSQAIFDWLKENVIDENWHEISGSNDGGLIETSVYLKEKGDAVRFRLVWNAKIK